MAAKIQAQVFLTLLCFDCASVSSPAHPPIQANALPVPNTIHTGTGALALTAQQALRPPEIGALTHLWGYLAQAAVFSNRHFVLPTSRRLSLHT